MTLRTAKPGQPSAKVTTYGWDVRNRLQAVASGSNTATNVYDHAGQRILTKHFGTSVRTVYLGDIDIRSVSATIPDAAKTPVPGVTIDFEGNRSYTAHNDQQSIVHDTRPASTLDIFYQPYGQMVNEAHSIGGISVRHTTTVVAGKAYLNEYRDTTSLNYLNNRHYDSNTGIFISVDPIARPSEPASLNPYTYARANPVTLSDADGLDPCPRTGCSAIDSGGRNPCGYAYANLQPCAAQDTWAKVAQNRQPQRGGCGWSCKLVSGFGSAATNTVRSAIGVAIDSVRCPVECAAGYRPASTTGAVQAITHTVTHPEDLITNCVDDGWNCAGETACHTARQSAEGRACCARDPTWTTYSPRRRVLRQRTSNRPNGCGRRRERDSARSKRNGEDVGSSYQSRSLRCLFTEDRKPRQHRQFFREQRFASSGGWRHHRLEPFTSDIRSARGYFAPRPGCDKPCF